MIRKSDLLEATHVMKSSLRASLFPEDSVTPGGSSPLFRRVVHIRMIIILICWIEVQLPLTVLREDGMIDLPEHAQLIIRPECLEVAGSDLSDAGLIGKVDTEVEVSEDELVIMLLGV